MWSGAPGAGGSRQRRLPLSWCAGERPGTRPRGRRTSDRPAGPYPPSAAPGGPATTPGRAASSRIAVDRPFALEGGGRLRDVDVAYETWGDARRRRVQRRARVPRLTGDSHVAGPAGPRPPDARVVGRRGRARAWPIDTDRYFVVCANVLGGCQGTTGPASIDPADRPAVRLDASPSSPIRDMVRVQAALADHLGHRAGGCRVRRRLDGRHAGARVGRSCTRTGCGRSSPIATCAQATAQQIAWGAIGRRAIRLDPQLAGRRLLRRRARRRSPRGPGHRPHGRPDHVPLRRRVHRPVRPRAGRAAARRLRRCGSASRSSATSTTTATSWSAASTPTATCCSARRWTCTTSAAGRGGLEAAHGAHRGCRRWSIGITQRHALPDLPAAADPRAARRATGTPAELRRDRLAPRPRRVPHRARPGRPSRSAPFLDDVEKEHWTDHDATRRARRPARPTRSRSAPGATTTARRSRPVLWATTHVRHADARRGPPHGRRCRGAERFYRRYANPTVTAFEDAVAELEGAEAGAGLRVGHGRGRHGRCMALCSTGDHIVAQRQIYSGTQLFLQGVCPRFGIDVTFVDGTEPGAFAAAVRPGRTMLVVAETPANPQLALDRPRRARRHRRARSRSSTRRSPRRSSSGRSTTASTWSSTRPPRASPATTTPRSAWWPARASCSTRSGATRVLHGAQRVAVRRHERAAGHPHAAGAHRAARATTALAPGRVARDATRPSPCVRYPRPRRRTRSTTWPSGRWRYGGSMLAFDLRRRARGRHGRSSRACSWPSMAVVARRSRDARDPPGQLDPRRASRPTELEAAGIGPGLDPRVGRPRAPRRPARRLRGTR